MSRTTVSHEDKHIYEFTPNLESVYTAESGESLTIETIDSLNNTIQEDSNLIEEIPKEINSATGPVAIEGAEPGDILKVKIEDVRINEERGRVITVPEFGLLQDHDDIEHPFTRVTPVKGDTIEFEDIVLDINPVIGTIGVAPATESYTTLVPHNHGGNLDTTDMTGGTTAYFPVFQEEAMLAMGDSKAMMADGEMCGTGAEIGTDIDITVEILKNSPISIERPLLKTGEAWKTVASAETMETAVKLANRDMIILLEREYGLETTEAYMLSSLVGGLEISQVVDPLVTVRNAVPSKYLSNPFDTA